jgi:hypothetical protein
MTEKPTCGGSPTVFLTSRAESLPLAMSSRPSKPADDPISATGLGDRYAGSGEGGSSYMPPGAGDDLLGHDASQHFRSTKRNYVADAPLIPKEEAVPKGTASASKKCRDFLRGLAPPSAKPAHPKEGTAEEGERCRLGHGNPELLPTRYRGARRGCRGGQLVQRRAVGRDGTGDRHLYKVEAVNRPDRSEGGKERRITRYCCGCAGAKKFRLRRVVLDHRDMPSLGQRVAIRIAVGEGLGVGTRRKKPGNLRTRRKGQRTEAETANRTIRRVKSQTRKQRARDRNRIGPVASEGNTLVARPKCDLSRLGSGCPKGR